MVKSTSSTTTEMVSSTTTTTSASFSSSSSSNSASFTVASSTVAASSSVSSADISLKSSVDVNSLIVPIQFDMPDLPPVEGDAQQRINALVKRAEMEAEAKGEPPAATSSIATSNVLPCRTPSCLCAAVSNSQPVSRFRNDVRTSVLRITPPFLHRPPGRAVPTARKSAESASGNLQKTVQKKVQAEESVRPRRCHPRDASGGGLTLL